MTTVGIALILAGMALGILAGGRDTGVDAGFILAGILLLLVSFVLRW